MNECHQVLICICRLVEAWLARVHPSAATRSAWQLAAVARHPCQHHLWTTKSSRWFRSAGWQSKPAWAWTTTQCAQYQQKTCLGEGKSTARRFVSVEDLLSDHLIIPHHKASLQAQQLHHLLNSHHCHHHHLLLLKIMIPCWKRVHIAGIRMQTAHRCYIPWHSCMRAACVCCIAQGACCIAQGAC